MPPLIAILGAGPSGLTLARLLEVHNIDYIIYERDPSPSEAGRGGTLDIHAGSGQEALKRCGLFEKFKTIARYDAQESKAVDKAGNLIWHLKDDGSEDRPEIDRKDLRDLLLQSLPEQNIRWNCVVKQVCRKRDGSVAVCFANGDEGAGFQLVVGADGAWSKARGLVTNTQPQYSGYCYLQSSVSGDNAIHNRLSEQAGPGSYAVFTGGKAITVQCLADGSYMVYAQLQLPEHWAKTHGDYFHSPGFRQQLVDTYYADWPDEMTYMIREADNFSYAWHLYSLPLDAIPWQHVPGITLIGDAAHLGLPNGEGVNCGMYDALQLAQEIMDAGIEDMDQAVQRYEAKLFPRAREHIEDGRKMNGMFFASDSPKELKQWMSMMMAGMGSSAD